MPVEYNSDLQAPEELNDIIIRGAREHNLKNVSLSIPREKFVVITGLSGSGKSSLAFDTLYAEGQRRYVEVLSPYAKQFLGMMKKPDVDSIEGLSPAISIEQKSISTNPRSTVGTTTEIYDYLRLLFAKLGVQYSLESDVPVEKKTTEEIIEEIYRDFPERKIQILAPIIRGRKGHYHELFESLRRQGFTRVRVDSEIREIEEGMKLSRFKIHDIELVIDRTIVDESQKKRITESMELALNRGEGFATIIAMKGPQTYEEKLYSTNFSDPVTGRSYEALAPNMFSFNSPYGACPICNGIGEVKEFDISVLITDPTKSIVEGGIEAIGKRKQNWLWTQINAFADKHGVNIVKPIEELDKADFDKLLFGDADSEISVDYKFSGSRKLQYKQNFVGIIESLKHQYENPPSASTKKSLENYMISHVCSGCGGSRLKQESLMVKLHGYNIADLVSMDIEAAIETFRNISSSLSQRERVIGTLVIKEIIERLEFLSEVGVSYLSLNRAVRSLSGGESQRIRLASQIGSQLVGIMYVLDEPSIGLHQHDNYKLINSLKKLRDMGNTVLVVEHDKSMIEESDFFIDIGPGAGVHGGEIIIEESPDKIASINSTRLDRSLTVQYLRNMRKIDVPAKRREGSGNSLVLKGATGNNLRKVNVEIPLGKMICVTGMSGSGKSTLINDTLYPILSREFTRSNKMPLHYESVSGLEHIDKVIEINQAPIGRTPRSNPATYTGIFTLIRDFFAMLPESKVRGYKPGRFSFNVKGGRCEECQGAGMKKIEMNFLPDVYVRCDVCEGKRYNNETLAVKYKDKSISDVLDMTVEEAADFFSEIPKLKRKLDILFKVGLGYITLGQQAPTLSGGEAQRVKLATELSKIGTGKTVYMLDEPTTGLHFEDIRILLKLLDRLVDKGNTVIIIEHNLDVVKRADWVIDLGPEGGRKGGYIIAEGTPEQIAQAENSFTGMYLKSELKNFD